VNLRASELFGRAPARLQAAAAGKLRVLGLLVVASFVLGGCQLPTFGAFRGATTQGKDEFKIWSGMFIAGLIVAIFVWGLIFWAVVKYRRRGDEIPRQTQNHLALEITYTVIPFVMVLVIFYFTVLTENNVDAVSSHPNEIVDVNAFRWGWQFTYKDGSNVSQGVVIRTAAEPKVLAEPATSSQYPQLVLPDNATIRIVLTSNDVIHGFYVPAFNFSRYAQPGVTNTFDLTTTTDGVFSGQCTQYCGWYHSEMLFSVRVESASAFSSWLSNAQASQGAS